MAEVGGEVYTPERLGAEVLRAELCQIASRHSYQHGPRIVDEILGAFHITRKPTEA